MKRFTALAIAFCLLLASPTAAAAALQYYGIEDNIRDDLSVHNVITLKFNESIPHLDYRLNFNAANLQARADFPTAACELRDSTLISCDLAGITPQKNQLTLEFDTDGGVVEEDGKFAFSVAYGFLPTERAFVLIRLPPYAILSEEVANASYLPADGKTISDGRRIGVFWERDLLEDQTMQFSVSYQLPENVPSVLVISLTGIVIVAMVAVVAYARRRHEQPPAAEVITSVLNEDEKRVVDILTAEGGKALQKTIVRQGNFSKAKVSRLLKDMRERGLVEIEPVSGRENRIVLSMGKKEAKPTEPAPPPQPETKPPEPAA